MQYERKLICRYLTVLFYYDFILNPCKKHGYFLNKGKALRSAKHQKCFSPFGWHAQFAVVVTGTMHGMVAHRMRNR